MIEDKDLSVGEVLLALLTSPLWVPVWGVIRLVQALRAKPPAVELVVPEVLQPWKPTSDLERAVYAALILAGEPVNNRRLAALMGVSPGEASKRVETLRGKLRKQRLGREVLISLPREIPYHARSLN